MCSQVKAQGGHCLRPEAVAELKHADRMPMGLQSVRRYLVAHNSCMRVGVPQLQVVRA
jgi:hypothetical protein